MRNIWFPKGAAEYMTKQRFVDMGLTDAAIGVRDRTFGKQLALEQQEPGTQTPSVPPETKSKRKEVMALSVSSLNSPPDPAHLALHPISQMGSKGGSKGTKERERENRHH